MINYFKEGKRKLDIEGKLSGEAAMRLIAGIVSNSGNTEPQVNLPNEGQITNLLPDAVVETPALIDRGGVHSTFIGSLPKGIAAICNIQILLQRLVVDAAIHGDIGKAKQAILADPVVQDNEAAKYAFKELFETHKDLLPQFRKG